MGQGGQCHPNLCIACIYASPQGRQPSQKHRTSDIHTSHGSPFVGSLCQKHRSSHRRCNADNVKRRYPFSRRLSVARDGRQRPQLPQVQKKVVLMEV